VICLAGHGRIPPTGEPGSRQACDRNRNTGLM
jgi:hypothetical protein